MMTIEKAILIYTTTKLVKFYKDIQYCRRHGKYPADNEIMKLHSDLSRFANKNSEFGTWSAKDTEFVIIDRMASILFEQSRRGVSG